MAQRACLWFCVADVTAGGLSTQPAELARQHHSYSTARECRKGVLRPRSGSDGSGEQTLGLVQPWLDN